MNFQNTNKQKGFTLIELIIVIIILGILAVTAAPKFLDISNDASKSTVTGVQGALQAATQLVRSKARIDGVNIADQFDGTDDQSVTIDGSTIQLDKGVPAAYAANVLAMLDINGVVKATGTTATAGFDFVAVQDSATDNTATIVRIYPAGSIDASVNGTLVATTATGASLCYVEYVFDGTGTATSPTVSVPSGFTC